MCVIASEKQTHTTNTQTPLARIMLFVYNVCFENCTPVEDSALRLEP